MPLTKLTLTTCLWFNGQAEAAAAFYTSIFPNSKTLHIQRYTEAGKEFHGREPGSVLVVEFSLDGHRFVGLNGGPQFNHSEAVSFMIDCKDQEEVDYYWGKLGEGGDEAKQQCGWVADRFGVSWQVVPTRLKELLAIPLAILVPTTTSDISAAIRFANAHALPFLATTGGHGASIWLSEMKGGLLIYMRNMTSFEVSKDRRTVKPVIVVYSLYNGPLEQARGYSRPIRNLNPVAYRSGKTEYPGIQAVMATEKDGPVCEPKGSVIYRGFDVNKYNLTAVRNWFDIFTEKMVTEEAFAQSFCMLEGYSVQGVQAVPADSTAFPHRGQRLLLAPIIIYDIVGNATLDKEAELWGDEMATAAFGGVPRRSYVNYAHGDESLEALYGYESWRQKKLRALKQKYDPENRFRFFNPIVVDASVGSVAVAVLIGLKSRDKRPATAALPTPSPSSITPDIMAKRTAEEEKAAGPLKAGGRPDAMDVDDDNHNEMGDFEDEFEDEFESEDEIIEAGVDGRPDAEREAEEAMDVDPAGPATFIVGRTKLEPGQTLTPRPDHIPHAAQPEHPMAMPLFRHHP
ncbi:hypothetical protein N0V88_007792 [Collariella sp. IMI 366227]|nr:hypothetical protein N0V88_007792 [Collariella sp. IMI 366227]